MSTLDDAPVYRPFKSPAEHLTAFISAVKIRCQRISMEIRLAEAKGDIPPLPDYMPTSDDTDTEGNLKNQVADLREKEECAFAILSALEEAHCEDPGREPLPVDVACQEEGLPLEGPERFILLALTLPCLGQELAKNVYDPLDRIYYTGLTTEALVALVLPDAENLEARVKARKLFHGEAPLVHSGLVHVEYGIRTVHAEDIWDAKVYLTIDGFARVMGDPELVNHPKDKVEPTASKRTGRNA